MASGSNIAAANEVLNASFVERPMSMFVLRPARDEAIGMLFSVIAAFSLLIIRFGWYIIALFRDRPKQSSISVAIEIVLILSGLLFIVAVSFLFKTVAEVKDDVIMVKGKEYHVSDIQEICIGKNNSVKLISEDQIIVKLSKRYDNCDELICWAKYYHLTISHYNKKR